MIETNLLGAMTATEVFLDADSKRAAEEATAEIGIPAQDIADVIRLRRQPPAERDAQRDPRAPNRAGHVSGTGR